MTRTRAVQSARALWARARRAPAAARPFYLAMAAALVIVSRRLFCGRNRRHSRWCRVLIIVAATFFCFFVFERAAAACRPPPPRVRMKKVGALMRSKGGSDGTFFMCVAARKAAAKNCDFERAPRFSF